MERAITDFMVSSVGYIYIDKVLVTELELITTGIDDTEEAKSMRRGGFLLPEKGAISTCFLLLVIPIRLFPAC